MPLRRESDLEAKCVSLAAGLGIQSKKVGDHGWPDRLFIMPSGEMFFVEFKRAGEKLRPRQVTVARRLASHSVVVLVIDNAKTFESAIEDLLRCRSLKYYAVPVSLKPDNPRWHVQTSTKLASKDSRKLPVPSARSRASSGSRPRSSGTDSTSRSASGGNTSSRSNRSKHGSRSDPKQGS